MVYFEGVAGMADVFQEPDFFPENISEKIFGRRC